MAAGDGLVTMTPTSIVVAGAGSSASIQSDGSVDFTSATSLSLNGVFTSSHDNYLVVMRHVLASGIANIQMRLRVAGTDASGGDYASQNLQADGTGKPGERFTSQTVAYVGQTDSEQRSGDNLHIYGPGLAQPTAFRNVNVYGDSGAALVDRASTHSLSTAYDGFTLLLSASSFSGNIVVFGYEE